jgi:hypothetical protein
MSRFFTEIEFEEPETVEQKPETVVHWDREKLDAAWTEILSEIEKIKGGTSDYMPYAVNPGRFGFPAENKMKNFVSKPSDKNFEGVHAICRQDFKGRAGDRFHSLLKACREEKPND